MRPETTTDELAIHAVALRLVNAVNTGDIPAILGCWTPDGVMLPPNHPALHGHSSIAEYFRRIFILRRLSFTLMNSVVMLFGEAAVERLTYTSLATSLTDGSTMEDVGKGLHVYARQPDGSWKIVQDIWNSDRPEALPLETEFRR